MPCSVTVKVGDGFAGVAGLLGDDAGAGAAPTTRAPPARRRRDASRRAVGPLRRALRSTRAARHREHDERERGEHQSHRLFEGSRTVAEWDGRADLDEAEPPIELQRRGRAERNAQENLSHACGARPVERGVDDEPADTAIAVRRVHPDLIERRDLGIIGIDAHPRETDRSRVVLDDQRQLRRRVGTSLETREPFVVGECLLPLECASERVGRVAQGVQSQRAIDAPLVRREPSHGRMGELRHRGNLRASLGGGLRRAPLTCDHLVTYHWSMHDDDLVFKALADPTRRFLLDRLFARDGRTLTELESELEMTRFGVMKHLRVLEDAGLVVTRKEGREKLHFLNPVPIRLIHDRWIDKFTERRVSALTDLKRQLEEESA